MTFGSTAATNVVVASSTQITATTPAGSAGAVTVTVTVSGAEWEPGEWIHLRCAADGDQRVSPNSWIDGGRDGGDDHGDELRGGSDGDVWEHGSDERGGDEQHDDHGDDAGRECGCGDGDGDGERAERESGQRVHLHCHCRR